MDLTNAKELLYNAKNGYTENVRSLLDRGVDIHACDDIVLRESARHGHTEIVCLLLDRGANIHANYDEALRISAKNGHTEVVRLLLDRGANIHAYNDDETLRGSARHGHIEVVSLLLDRLAKSLHEVLLQSRTSMTDLDDYIHDMNTLRTEAEHIFESMVAANHTKSKSFLAINCLLEPINYSYLIKAALYKYLGEQAQEYKQEAQLT